MAIDFPNSPTNGQIYTSGDKSWIWDGTTWKAYGASLSPTVLKVDSTNTRVGINNQSPAYTLDVDGTVEATQFLQGTNYLTPYTGFRNAVINGNFDVWQRGTFVYPSTTPLIISADRWYMSSAAGGGYSQVGREVLAPGSISGYDAPWFLGSIHSLNAPNIFSQRIEDVRTFAGQTVTLSFWVNNFGYGNNPISSSLTQNFGSGGSTAVTTNFSTVTSAFGWVRRSVTLTLPSISGTTVGTNSYLQLTLNTNNHYYVGIAGVQLELGSVATPFERRPPGTELALCQRYFYSSGTVHQHFVSMNANQFGEAHIYSYPVSMRAVPTITGSFTSNDNATLLTTTANIDRMYIRVTCTNNGFAYGSFNYSFTAASEL